MSKKSLDYCRASCKYVGYTDNENYYCMRYKQELGKSKRKCKPCYELAITDRRGRKKEI